MIGRPSDASRDYQSFRLNRFITLQSELELAHCATGYSGARSLLSDTYRVTCYASTLLLSEHYWRLRDMRNILTILLFVWAGNLLGQTRLYFETVAEFDRPWALAPLPNGCFPVTEMLGTLRYVSSDSSVTSILEAPSVMSVGQVGLLDV